MSDINILFLSANPQDEDYLLLKKEYDVIQDTLGKHPDISFVKLIPAWDTQKGDLVMLFQKYQPAIVHFCGHASKEGLVFTNNQGITEHLKPDLFIELLTQFKNTIRFVVLNACQTGFMAKDIAKAVGCAIGIRKEIDDERAIKFVNIFYNAFFSGRSVKEAYDNGFIELKIGDLPKKSHPILYLGEKTNPNDLYLISPLYDIKWLTECKDNRDNFINILAFSKHIHHMFQLLDYLYLNGLVNNLSKLSKEENNILSISDIDRNWTGYLILYHKLWGEFNREIPTHKELIPMAFTTLQNQKSLNPLIKEKLTASFAFYTEIANSLEEFLNTQNIISDKIHDLLKNQNNQLLINELSCSVLSLQILAKSLVTNSDEMILNKIEILSQKKRD